MIKRAITILALCGIILVASGVAQAVTTTGWTEYASNPVYSPGKAYYPTILKEGGTYTMWSDSASGLDMATSTDGINWTSQGTATGLTNPRHALVEKIDAQYRIWYDEGSDAHLYSIEAIRTATSSDGLTWLNDQAITQVGSSVITGSHPDWNKGSYGPTEVIYNPSGSPDITVPTDEASVWANKYVMYYDGTTGADEFMGLAVSNDGINWRGYNDGAAPVLDSSAFGWDDGYVCFGTIIKENDDAYHMWYSGGSVPAYALNEGIGYAFSTDGINWTRDAGNPIFHKNDGVGWRDNRTYTPMVIGDEMWFTGKSTAGVYSIGYATPEPATMSLLALGGLAALIRRRNRK